MEKFTNKINEINEMNEPDTVNFTKIQEDALNMLRDAVDKVVVDMKEKWLEAEDDLTWLEEKYYEETLKNLSEIIARKIKS